MRIPLDEQACRSGGHGVRRFWLLAPSPGCGQIHGRHCAVSSFSSAAVRTTVVSVSTKHALRFLQRLREDPVTRGKLMPLQEDANMDALVRMGAELEYPFDTRELREAFRHDWTMRWVHHKLRAGIKR